MINRLRTHILALMTALTLAGQAHAAWDVEYWQYLYWTNWVREPYKLYTVGEARVNKDDTHFYYFRLTENFQYRVRPYLDLEAHYSFIYNKSPGATKFTITNRLEFEVNPFVTLDNGIILRWRNRIEVMKKQYTPKIQTVFRHRFLVAFPINNVKNLEAIFCSDEIYYDCDLNRFTQNRFIPIEMKIPLTRHVSLDIVFMIRNNYSLTAKKWHRSFVLASQLDF